MKSATAERTSGSYDDSVVPFRSRRKVSFRDCRKHRRLFRILSDEPLPHTGLSVAAEAGKNMSSIAARVKIVCSLLIVLATPVAHAADYVTLSGAQLFQRYCASCHGVAGRGDGPVAGFIRVEVPDLTLLMRSQGNAYSRERIEKIVDGRFLIGAHGTRAMPIWGEGFSRAEIGNPDAERATLLVIGRLV
ncbi:MAG TPA: c-type cytochrome, partial [Steroidobacteraceae bacterium]|nr:c-type cytochrome [Steroidobacteraceae bacterium]